jgi:hypothetical protein
LKLLLISIDLFSEISVYIYIYNIIPVWAAFNSLDDLDGELDVGRPMKSYSGKTTCPKLGKLGKLGEESMVISEVAEGGCGCLPFSGHEAVGGTPGAGQPGPVGPVGYGMDHDGS